MSYAMQVVDIWPAYVVIHSKIFSERISKRCRVKSANGRS